MLIDLTKIRNIGIVAHIDAGRTIVTKCILFYTGVNYKIGETHDGASTMDWMEQKQERGITITSAVAICFWKNSQINIIDTLGYVDFTIKVERSLCVLDGAVAVFDGREGAESQSETVWHQADKYNVPRICYINKMDKLGVGFDFSTQTIRNRLHAIPIILNFPIDAENDSSDLVDILETRVIRPPEKDAGSKETRGFAVEYEKIPSELIAKAEGLRAQLVETVTEAGDTLVEGCLGSEEFSIAELRAGIRKLTVVGETFPILAGPAFKNKDIQPVLDTVLDCLPSPLDVLNIEDHAVGNEEEVPTYPIDGKAPFSTLAFKVATHPLYDKLIYVRVYPGKISQGEMILSTTKGKKERIGELFQIHSNKEDPVEKAHTSHIYAFIGLEGVTADDTLCAQDSPIVLESMTLPAPVIRVAIEPETKGSQEKLGVAIQKLSEENPTFTVSLDRETGQTVTDGMSEFHLDVFVDHMRREFKVEVSVGTPRVAYRETIRKKVDKVEYTHKRQTGGSSQSTKVQMSFEPLVADEVTETTDGKRTHYEFINAITGGYVSREYIPSVDAGVRDTMLTGVLADYPMTDIRAVLIDGAYRGIDSSEMAFKIADSMVFREGAKGASPVLLGPVMAVRVRTPEEYMGNVIGNPNSHRSMIAPMEDAVSIKIVRANVPLSEMFGCVGGLRSKTQGRAVHSMTFDSYIRVPKNVADEVIAKVKGA